MADRAGDPPRVGRSRGWRGRSARRAGAGDGFFRAKEELSVIRVVGDSRPIGGCRSSGRRGIPLCRSRGSPGGRRRNAGAAACQLAEPNPCCRRASGPPPAGSTRLHDFSMLRSTSVLTSDGALSAPDSLRTGHEHPQQTNRLPHRRLLILAQRNERSSRRPGRYAAGAGPGRSRGRRATGWRRTCASLA